MKLFTKGDNIKLISNLIINISEIIDDRSDIDQYHKNVTDLKEKMQAQGFILILNISKFINMKLKLKVLY